MNRRDYIVPAVDAVMSWCNSDADTALEIVHVVLQAIEERGFEVREVVTDA